MVRAFSIGSPPLGLEDCTGDFERTDFLDCPRPRPGDKQQSAAAKDAVCADVIEAKDADGNPASSIGCDAFSRSKTLDLRPLVTPERP
ncbi:hypothetical protein AB1Y20_001418 [Prymnesium parvum]|uniref:Uncharacterized protein n=1 Tax=Prymnesium parvum TaxID=97485 RepID=A0AB34KB02_PRYPA|mmetsp:Transcript_17800/g.37851  ORF Transcript_17800/g.37851 Transcript_17800/m.37851 type:complete len:88 (-) Transcript_17800:320-583(-)|eukprot:CAMPEP_0184393906 /NCGR_PEP_ID=MMETSP0007-20130409/37418_1 /TAXON_ID=97485 /ORGANISM="Prymnesium parvum, Strain Texoma1" /LENGTH=87 /DNA_ID=CAMNT_0026745205 /DNA_START=367 /DNA_END=630 /DNA_ORIENTATION=-